MKKSAIGKVLEEFETTMGCIDECKYGLYEDVGCPAHGYDAMKAKKFIRSAIETAFKEVRPERKPNDTNENSLSGALKTIHAFGYNNAIFDLDEKIKEYLKK